MISVLASNGEERGLLASRRAIYTALAGIIFSYAGSSLIAFYGGATGNEVLGYTLTAGTFAFTMMILYWAVFKMTDGYEETDPEKMKATQAKAPRVSLIAMLKMAATNPYLIVLLFGDFFRYMLNFIMSAAAAYYFTYVAKNMALFPTYLLLGSIAQVVGAYLAAPVTKMLSTRNASIAGLFGLGAALIVSKFVAYSIMLFFVFVLIARVFLGILSATMVALYSDVSVYSEWKSGQNATAWIMGLMTLSLKVAIISRGTVIPFILATAGFVATADPATASRELTDAVVNVFVLIPGIFAVISGVIIAFAYRLTKDKLTQYEKEIAERKAVQA